MGNTFGQLFRITTLGESHGGGVGVVIDGCPPRIALSEADIQRELDRRRPGQSAIVSQRNEEDRCQILSGVFEGQTLGTPISIVVMQQGRASGRLCADCNQHFVLHTPISPTKRNTEFETGRAGAAHRPEKRSAASPPARSHARCCGPCILNSRSSHT